MAISPETLSEIESALRSRGHLPRGYTEFIVKWMAFNRAYNETETARQDWEKVSSFAEKNQAHWTELTDLATQLVSIECIGSERVEDSDLVAPNKHVKSATHFLRKQLGIDTEIAPTHCVFAGCERAEKRMICDQVEPYAWEKGELVALLRLVYQVRCNLIHGEKRLMNNNEFQTNRDRQLIRISSEILDHVLNWLI